MELGGADFPRGSSDLFRYAQIGLFRLLTNSGVMGPQTLILRKAWELYQAWLADPRVEFYPEPRGLDDAFRQATAPFASRAASKWVGDGCLLAYARQTAAVLVTFDRALLQFARTQGFAAVRPAGQEPISR